MEYVVRIIPGLRVCFDCVSMWLVVRVEDGEVVFRCFDAGLAGEVAREMSR